ncbi:50S ribosomal protein L30 [Aneurinibacillus aneurinilyticus]|jgi:large subunit ribosomal protein L30|uniref:Large ribosomal subunit protein uL30 n=2 Tax=Aneurinibacillus aneurinilyticus TaxID=1391 RepID=A0A848D1X2_ANEAE|nr:50S ribosomal protein L30 [Aneurinibacillus aneurinilyticus]ERI06768.1 ribosomal protein L30 [Aneurinibacillus aneurinilyticus ATCC 12856]MCI1695222.1 50S ribosomal protein L30 [Aneurinibacillus aneurinilyticus]MED0673299.1 50S ribosomal protein L30 [Aneurinibacillus aneurinilyticus]MED0707329.1 50S ribosomal protein L30 [Aneurinibacillus aneurinilyticus]MED0721624.1 50S ribosomal protein L30 [Aneurinibacillus aneurinilyticus]
MAKLQITLKRSLIGRTQNQKATVAALGLRKLNHTVVKEDNAAMRGMVEKVKHMVEVKEIAE